MARHTLCLITGNANKLADIRAILSNEGIVVEGRNVHIPELQGTIEEITIAKCKTAAEIV